MLVYDMELSPSTDITTEEFISWSYEHASKGKRYELDNGVVVSMAPERVRHALIKSEVFYRLKEAVNRDARTCTVFSDGMAIRIDDRTVHEPDAAVRCGDRLPDDDVIYSDPIIVVEVQSPSTSGIDSAGKLVNYFRLPSLRHYLIVATKRPTVIHHERLEDGTIQTRILAAGPLRLDPPGITLDVASLFPA